MTTTLLIVAGSGRSGTSLFSGLTHSLGLHIPQPEVSANRTNPRGFGEPQWAVDFDRRMLRLAGVRLADARPEAWAASAKLTRRPEHREELRGWLARQFDQADRVVVKDPHLTWLVDLYHEAARDLSVNFAVATMLRNPIENVKSRQLAYGDAASSTSRLAGWLNVMLHVEERTRGLPRAMLKFEDLLDDWQAAVLRADRHLQLGLLSRADIHQVQAAADLIDPDLHRATGSWDELQVPTSLRELADETWTVLKDVADEPRADAEVRADLDDLRSRYVQLYGESAAIAHSSVAAARIATRREMSGTEQQTTRAASTPGGRSLRRTLPARAVRRVDRKARSVMSEAKLDVISRTPFLPMRRHGDRIYLLIYSIDGYGGVARTFGTLANGLVDRHEVEIISLFRHREAPPFHLDERVRVSYLEDLRIPDGPPGSPKYQHARDNPGRSDWERELDSRPSVLRARGGPYSALTDRLLRRKLGTLAPGVLLSDRPTMHAAAATFVPSKVIRLATEHSSFEHRMPPFRQLLATHSRRFDALVVLNETEQRTYEKFLGSTTRVVTIPNAVHIPTTMASPASSRVLIACGSLGVNKGFDRVIEAFAPLASAYPDWRLHIYGRGRERDALTALIRDHGLEESVELKGYQSDLAEAYANASIFAVGSHFEAFGLALTEAMSWGLPAISFDRASGPRHLVADGDNGMLIPDGDVGAYTEGLRRLIGDPDLRQKMGSRARETVLQYRPERVLEQWEQLIHEIRRERSAGRLSRLLR